MSTSNGNIIRSSRAIPLEGAPLLQLDGPTMVFPLMLRQKFSSALERGIEESAKAAITRVANNTAASGENNEGDGTASSKGFFWK